MAISFPLPPPSSPRAQKLKLKLISAVGLSQSPFTFSQQVQEFPGQIIGIEVTMPPMKASVAEDWIGWGCALYGQSGTFTWEMPGTNRGVYSGAPLVNGAHSAQSKTLAIKGANATVTGWAKRGDWIKVENLILLILADANTNGSGQVTLDVAPRLAAAIADNAPVTTSRSSATGLFRLASNAFEWDVDKARIHGITFTAIEAR